MLIGGVSASVFPALYFILMTAFFVISLFLTRKLFKTKGDFAFLIVIAVIFTIFLSMFATALDSYMERSVDFKQKESDVKHDIEAMNSNIDYYTKYIDYLNSQILDYNAKIDEMNGKITDLQNVQTVPEPVYVEQTNLDNSYLENDYWDEEEFWDDDEGWEDD